MTSKDKLQDITYAGIFAALTAILGFISVPLPFSPVPISGQSLAIMLAGSILTVRQAAFSMMTFILVGAVGLPIFAGGTGGIGIIIGPRGGYLIGFLVGAIAISLLKGTNKNIWRLAMANAVGGILVVYLIGVSWLSFVTGIGLQKAIVAGALPFIPGDLCKVLVASVLGIAVNKQLGKANVRL
jgi:biotin transport system substrate-specific component